MRLVSRNCATCAWRRQGASTNAARSDYGGLMRAGAGIVARLLAACLIFLPFNALAQQGVQSPKFDIAGFRVEGNSVLSATEVDAILQPYVGKQRDFADVQRALEALQDVYQRRGYGAVYVYLPEQRLEGGTIVLKVIEAKIDKITVTGNRYFSEANVRRALPDLKPGAVPNMVDIAENSRAANENPARQLQVVLKQSPTEGLIDAGVQVTDQPPLKPFVSLDNTGTPATGRERLGLGVQYANLWERDHVATLQYITSPTDRDKVKVYSLGYRFPIPTWGDSVDLYAGYSNVSAAQTQTPAGALSISGKGTLAGGRYNLILRRRGEYEQRVLFGFDYRKFENQCSLGSFGSAGCISTAGNPGADVETRPASIGYSGQLTQATRQAGFNVSYARNIPGGAHGGDADFSAVRAPATAHYGVLRYAASASSAAFGNWTVRGNLQGQSSSNALVPAEQFGLVGYTAVRGFLERELAGDKGYLGNLELYTPDVGSALGWKTTGARLLAFYDAGVAQINEPVAGQADRTIASSWGLGLRGSYGRNVTLRLDVARVVHGGGSSRASGDKMAHAGMVASF